MFLGLFRKKVKVVTPLRKKGSKRAKVKVKKVVGLKRKRSKLRKPKVTKARKARKVVRAKKAARPQVTMPQIVGRVTHYFPHVKAGVILVSNDTISLGDTLQIKGHSTDFKQKVTSIQINNVPIKEAKPGQEIGLLVKSRVRHNDIVYKLK